MFVFQRFLGAQEPKSPRVARRGRNYFGRIFLSSGINCRISTISKTKRGQGDQHFFCAGWIFCFYRARRSRHLFFATCTSILEAFWTYTQHRCAAEDEYPSIFIAAFTPQTDKTQHHILLPHPTPPSIFSPLPRLFFFAGGSRSLVHLPQLYSWPTSLSLGLT